MLDIEGIEARLDKLDEYVQVLKELQGAARSTFLTDYHLYGLAERYLQLSIECLLDIGIMLVTGLRLRRPERHQDVVDILVEAGVLSPELGTRLAGIAGFRNILVHEYLQIDRNLVYQKLQEGIADFENFAAEVVRFLQQNRGDDKEIL
ncbi:MAG: DUF86 domain-containing protein [Anaerolineae bacterium]|nr:DUF86 domain-containing protein [Anaerolineae bacterium]